MGLKQTIIRGGLESLFFTGAHYALKPFVGGVGVILTFHHVRPARPIAFSPIASSKSRRVFLPAWSNSCAARRRRCHWTKCTAV